MKDCPTRRNRIAAITVNSWNAALAEAVSNRTTLREPVVDASAVSALLGRIRAALDGCTDLEVLGIDPTSTPAVQIRLLTQETPKP